MKVFVFASEFSTAVLPITLYAFSTLFMLYVCRCLRNVGPKVVLDDLYLACNY